VGMRRHLVPGLLITCTLLVAFWIVASQRNARPFKPFNLTYSDFAGYCPSVGVGMVHPLVVSTNDPAEPNIAAYGVTMGAGPDGARMAIRLVHGYNMPMCMKIKGYRVDPVKADTSRFPGLPVQVWRVTSSVGDVSVWATTMIRSEDFAVTKEDITSMAFPRVDVPDDPNWVPRGFTSEDLKHPVQSLKLWVRARWNASRMDVLTFLRLRQPAWASEELLTYVSRSMHPEVTPATEPDVIRQVLTAHAAMLKELQAWRGKHKEGIQGLRD
jgi:hypothetical protein